MKGNGKYKQHDGYEVEGNWSGNSISGNIRIKNSKNEPIYSGLCQNNVLKLSHNDSNKLDYNQMLLLEAILPHISTGISPKRCVLNVNTNIEEKKSNNNELKKKSRKSVSDNISEKKIVAVPSKIIDKKPIRSFSTALLDVEYYNSRRRNIWNRPGRF